MKVLLVVNASASSVTARGRVVIQKALSADHDVTDVIEDAVSQVEGIDYIQSQSTYGVSTVTVYFRLTKSVDVAMQDVQNAVSAARRRQR